MRLAGDKDLSLFLTDLGGSPKVRKIPTALTSDNYFLKPIITSLYDISLTYVNTGAPNREHTTDLSVEGNLATRLQKPQWPTQS